MENGSHLNLHCPIVTPKTMQKNKKTKENYTKIMCSKDRKFQNYKLPSKIKEKTYHIPAGDLHTPATALAMSKSTHNLNHGSKCT